MSAANMAFVVRVRIQIDGVPARACLTLAVQVDGAKLRTVEGLAPEQGRLSIIQRSRFASITRCNADSARQEF